MRYLAVLPILAAASLACGDEDAPVPIPAPRYITSFGFWGTGEGEFEYPGAIRVGPDSLLYVADDGNHRIEVFTPDGEFVTQWPVGRPVNGEVVETILFAPDGTVYPLTNYGYADSTYEFLGCWEFVNAINGLEIDDTGNLYVCGRHITPIDPFHSRVEGPYFWKFSPQRELIKKWGYPGPRDTTGWFGGPMTWNTKGNLVVLGSLDSTAAVFELTPDGDPVSAWRIPTPEGKLLWDIACDPSGRVHVSGLYTQQMYMFDSRGKLLTQWNTVTEGKEPLEHPMGIAVDASGFLYVVDWSRYRVVKYDTSP